jgi:alpha-tubulin suppressor-like RCC1 family protein
VGLYGWGSNEKGQLGLGQRTTLDRPVSLPLPNSVTASSLAVVKCGGAFSMLLSRSGLDLYCTGENSSGQLGLGDGLVRKAFCRVDLSSRVLFFALGAYFSLIVTQEGLFGCGKNNYGQLGEQSYDGSSEFKPVSDGLNGRFRFLGCGYHHALAVSESQSFGRGRNDYGQLGFLPDGPMNYISWKPKESSILSIIASQEEDAAKNAGRDFGGMK